MSESALSVPVATLGVTLVSGALAVVFGKFRPASTVTVGGSPRGGGRAAGSASEAKRSENVLRINDDEIQVHEPPSRALINVET